MLEHRGRLIKHHLQTPIETSLPRLLAKLDASRSFLTMGIPCGIDSISLNPDTIIKTTQDIVELEGRQTIENVYGFTPTRGVRSVPLVAKRLPE